MPVFISILDADAAALVRRLQGAAPVVRGLIARGLDAENLNTVSRIQETKLTAAGPRYLNVRTGRLRRAARATKATVDGSVIRSAIGDNVSYAAAHEFGYTGPQTVRPFVRRVKSRDLRGKVDGKRRRIASGIAYVRGFVRRVNFRERRMFRDGLAEAVAAGGYQRTIGGLIRDEFGRGVGA